ncbi:MAG: hypothetical protein MdMp014T_2277 [Treponematales bacterium]
MKGTNNVKRLLAAAGALIMGMALVTGFAGCKTDDDEDSDPVAPEFQGTYTGTLSNGTATDTSVTVSANAITGTNVTISNVSTSGGGSLSYGEQAIGSWAYVLEGSAKIGVAYTISGTNSNADGTVILLGKTQATNLVSQASTNGITGFTTTDANAVSTTYGAYLTKQ